MQKQTAHTIELGTLRELTCSRCSNSQPRLRQHIYVAYRSGRQLDHYRECTICGNSRLPSAWDDARNTKDPETDRLHGQWREDNESGDTSGKC